MVKPPQPPSYDEKKIIADKVNDTVGSGRFILLQTSFLILYIIFQSLAPRAWAFDRFPFILLNLLLSFQAAYTGPFILWSQNRAAVRDRQVMAYVRDMVALIKKDIERDVKTEARMEKEIKELNAKMDAVLAALKPKEDGQ